MSLVRFFLLLLSCVAPAAASDLLVSSRFSDNVLRFDGATGAAKGVFASGNGLDNPNGIAFGPDRNLYVGLGDVGRIMIFDGTSGAFVRDFVVPANSGGLGGCRAIAFLPDGDLLVDNGPANNVLRYERDTGRFKGVFASGAGMEGPVGLTVGPDGNVYVGAALSNAVYVYDGNGALLRTLAPPAGQSNVTGVRFDATGKLLVAHSVSNTVRRIDPLTGAGPTFATGGGLNIPIGITLLPNGDLLVGSFGNDKVVRYDGSSGAPLGDFIASGTLGLDGTHNFAFVPDAAGLDDRFDGAWTFAGAEKQGVLIDVAKESSVFFAATFTYDPAGGAAAAPRWYALQGGLAGSRADFVAYRVASGAFLAPVPTALDAVGAGSVDLLDCNHLQLHLALQGVAAADVLLVRLLPNAACVN